MGGRGSSSGLSTAKSISNYENLKTISEAEKKDLFYHQSQGEDSYEYLLKHNRIEELKQENKYNAILINESLPKLQGTEKQIAWAESIRGKAIMSDIQRAVDNVRRLSIEQRKQLITEVNKRYGTHYTTISQAISRTMKENPAYKKFGKTNSAKEIIDKR